MFNKKQEKNSIALSIAQSKIVRGYEIRRLPLGKYLEMLERVRTLPAEIMTACFPGKDTMQVLTMLKTVTPDGLNALLLNLIATVPSIAVDLLALLTGIDAKALREDENIGLDGVTEMIQAFFELNGIENFMKAAREILSKARAAAGKGTNTGSKE